MDPKGNRLRSEPPSRSASERIRSVPPLDPTVAPSVTRIPIARASSVSGLRPVARPPVLASECLRDDIAPLEPHANTGRRALLMLGMISLVAGVLSATSRFGSSQVVGGGIALGGLLLVSASALSGYAARATFSAIAAILCGGSAIAALSATHSFSSQAWLVSLRALAPVFLASLLLVRATYRAHKPARQMLGPAILAFLCAALFAGGVPVWSPAASILPRVAASSMAVVALLALLGFMSEQTTGGTQVWSVLAVTVGALSLVLDGLLPFTFKWLIPAAALSAAMASLSLSLFQLVAARVGPVEREREEARHSMPPPSSLEDG